MLKPLSIFYYSIGNRKKTLTIIATISLCVAIVYFATLLAGSIFMVLKSKHEPHQYYSSVRAPQFQHIEDRIINDLKQFDVVVDVVPFEQTFTLYHGIISSEGISIYSLKNADIQYLLGKLELQVTEGRLPEANNEILLPKALAKNKGITIGDFIGDEVNDKEQLKGKHLVVGLLEGEALIGFQALPEDAVIQNRALVFLHENSSEVTQYLEGLAEKDYDAYTFKMAQMFHDNTKAVINILVTAIAIIIAIVVSLTLANISYIHLVQRKKDLSISYALGYSLRSIKIKLILEQLLFIIVGTITGILLAIGVTAAMNVLIFEPKGQYMILIYSKGFPFVLLIPMMVLLFNILMIQRMLKKFDPIIILEGRD